MAWRSGLQANEAPADDQVTEYYTNRRRPEPSAPPALGFSSPNEEEHWHDGAANMAAAVGGAGAAAAASMADQRGNVQFFVNNMHVHLHQNVVGSEGRPQSVPVSDPPPQIEAAQNIPVAAGAQFRPNDPAFQPAHSVQGVDFGGKVVSRFYRAQKHMHAQYNMITYTQCPSTAQSISHALTLHLSEKRSKHAIFLFDCNLVQELESKWPPTIHLSEIQSMLQELGQPYEIHRRKVRKEKFSLYFYVIKPFGVRFSQQGQRAWSGLFQWAHYSLEDSASIDRARSALSSPEMIAQVVGIGLNIAAL